MKDNFSTQSDDYAKFRPVYPQELVNYLVSLSETKDRCWDCGTGNGQLAVKLADHFEEVCATDISEKQLANAIQKENIQYSKQPAEKTNFPDSHFDLVTVAQAAHWFDHQRFNEEVKMVLKPSGVIALFGYALVQVDEEVQPIIDHFYWNITKPYWDPERDHIEAGYQTIPFPYNEIGDVPKFQMEKEVTLDELVGYISTWSAVQHYIKKNGHSPIDSLHDQLAQKWNSGKRIARFPFFIRVGRVK